ncbi:RagB/SusD family nutrient uptake outer membrane protein [Sphingobacterium siyangense]|uniref:RagB/SusD family nutrient uptake outer membrane protein n=1 Tax=Sphingobacterium siyangense TaxID=459529 RepID=UPI002FDE4F46
MMKLKTILFLGAISLSSCGKDFLNLNPETYVNGETFYKDESELEQAVTGAYNVLVDEGRVSLWLFGEMRSDNTTYQNNTTDRGHENREFIDQFLVNATAEPILLFWQQSYTGISRSNTVLENLERIQLSEVKNKQFSGEVRFLRAYHYFNLVRQFGGVPLRLESTKSPTEALSNGRASVEDIYNIIIEDLSSAAESLKGIVYSTSDKGRITEGAARTLLAKVYLTLKKYDEAIVQLRQVVQLGYGLNADYSKNFNPAFKNGTESIFEIQYLGSNASLFSDFMYRFAPYISGSAVTGDPQSPLAVESGWNIPTQDLIDSYEENDNRFDYSLALGYKNSEGTTVNVPYVKKYNYGFVERGRTNVNFPVLRYSDVLLMLAECLNEKGFQSGEAFNLLNQVRQRAGLKDKTIGNSDPSLSVDNQQEFRDAIFQERKIEFAFENQRWYDLLRTGKAVTIMNVHGAREKLKATYIPANAYQLNENKLLLPIPQKEVNLDGLTQNPQ